MKKLVIILSVAIVVSISLLAGYVFYINPQINYNKALEYMNNGNYTAAAYKFERLGEFKDSAKKVSECIEKSNLKMYEDAMNFKREKEYLQAIHMFELLGDYKDSKKQIKQCEDLILQEKYNAAVNAKNNGDYNSAIEMFTELGDYKDSKEQIKKVNVLAIVNAFKKALANHPSANAYSYYSLYDIDKNSVPELIVQSGTCEADRMMYVYVYDTVNKTAAKIFGRGFSHSLLRTYPGGNGLIIEYGHMGDYGIYKLSLSGNKITETVIHEKYYDYFEDYPDVSDYVSNSKRLLECEISSSKLLDTIR